MMELSNLDLALIQLALLHLRECPAGERETKVIDDLFDRVISECAWRADKERERALPSTQ